jgi:hypothetical protein
MDILSFSHSQVENGENAFLKVDVKDKMAIAFTTPETNQAQSWHTPSVPF